MTNQEIYDKVCDHFAKQGRQSVDAVDNACMLRGDNGTSCAVGCLIADEDYDPKMEMRMGNGVGMFFDDYPDVAKKIGNTKENIELLDALQTAHDFAKNRDNIVGRLMEIAYRFGLTNGPEQAIVKWDTTEQ